MTALLLVTRKVGRRPFVTRSLIGRKGPMYGLGARVDLAAIHENNGPRSERRAYVRDLAKGTNR